MLNAFKIYTVSLIFFESCCPIVKLEIKPFGGCYLIQHSHYLWMVDVILLLHGLSFGVICQLISYALKINKN